MSSTSAVGPAPAMTPRQAHQDMDQRVIKNKKTADDLLRDRQKERRNVQGLPRRFESERVKAIGRTISGDLQTNEEMRQYLNNTKATLERKLAARNIQETLAKFKQGESKNQRLLTSITAFIDRQPPELKSSLLATVNRQGAAARNTIQETLAKLEDRVRKAENIASRKERELRRLEHDKTNDVKELEAMLHRTEGRLEEAHTRYAELEVASSVRAQRRYETPAQQRLPDYGETAFDDGEMAKFFEEGDLESTIEQDEEDEEDPEVTDEDQLRRQEEAIKEQLAKADLLRAKVVSNELPAERV